MNPSMTHSQLSAATCTACQGGIPPMPRVEAEKYLAQTPGWELRDEATKLRRKFTFGNFMEAMAFAQKVGELCEREGHHPDISMGWGYCTVVFQTHKINGLHDNDFIMAAKVSDMAGQMRPPGGKHC